jgi:uncharacterized protein YwqG
MAIDDITRALQNAGLPHIAAVADRLVLPAIRIRSEVADEAELPIGGSKIGGRPDLPGAYEWPQHEGMPLGFLAQFDLNSANQYDAQGALPRAGILSFFYDFKAAPWGLYPQNRGGWRVLYFGADPSALARAEWPATLPILYGLPTWRPVFSVDLVLTGEPKWVAGLEPSQDEWRKAAEVWREVQPVGSQAESGVPVSGFEYLASRHQLLGHPTIVHYGGMPWECQQVASGRPFDFSFTPIRYAGEQLDGQAAAEIRSAFQRWRLLFQLGNVSGMPWPNGGEDKDDSVWMLSKLCDLWARGGLMYFWIERDRLAQRDFSNVWLLGASQL